VPQRCDILIGMLAGIAMGIEQISRWRPRMRTST
jgi:hypothetical protein